MIARRHHQKDVICFRKNIYNKMSYCDCHCDSQESINDDESSVPMHPDVAQDHNLDALIKEEILRNKEQPAMVAEKPDGLLTTTMAAMAVRIFFGLRTIGAAQRDA